MKGLIVIPPLETTPLLFLSPFDSEPLTHVQDFTQLVACRTQLHLQTLIV